MNTELISESLWLKIGGPILVGAAIAVMGNKRFTRWIDERRRERKKQTAIKRINADNDLYGYMQEVIEATAFKHSMIMKLTNGGGKLGPGSDMKMTCVREVVREGFEEESKYYNGVSAGSEEIELIARCIENGPMIIRTEDIPKNSKNRKRLEEKGIKCFFIYIAHIEVESKGTKSEKEEFHFGILNSKYDVNESEQGILSINTETTRKILNSFVENVRDCYYAAII